MAVNLYSNFSKLASDEIGVVLTFCDFSEREAMKMVDRKIYSLLKSFHIKCAAFIKKIPYPNGPEHPRHQLLDECCALGNVRFIPTIEIADSGTLITYIVSLGALGIKKLCLRGLDESILTDEVLLAIEEHLPNIESIDLHGSMISNRAVGRLLEKCLQLKHFSISARLNVTGKEWAIPVESKLSKISISHFTFLFYDCISAFLNLRGLKELSIVGCSIQKIHDSWELPENSELAKLSIFGCHGVDDNNLSKLLQSPNLREFNCDDNNSSVMSNRRVPFREAQALRRVHVDEIGPADCLFMDISQILNAPNLEILVIGKGYLIFPIGCMKLNLRILIIDESPLLTDDVINMFLKYAPQLERFEIGDGCTQVSRSARNIVKKTLKDRAKKTIERWRVDNDVESLQERARREAQNRMLDEYIKGLLSS